MAAKTTIKVATLTGAAKDDLLVSSATGLTEDHVMADLNALANDPGAARLYSLKQDISGLSPTDQLLQQTIGSTTTLSSGATISINSDGTIHYDGSTITASLDHLAQGDSFTDSFSYTVRLANGALSTATASVLIGGVNDPPTLAPVAPATIHDTAAADPSATIHGTLTGNDVDDHAVLSYSASGADASGTALIVNADGTYSFTVTGATIDALHAGEHLTVGYTASVTDEFGASASRPLEFTVLGINDPAVFSGDVSGSVTEDDTLVSGGVLIVADRDHDESSFQSPATLSGTYGDFTFDTSGGDWTYTLNNAAANVQALNAGDLRTDTLAVLSIDGTAQLISVEIHGADEQGEPEANPVTTFLVNHGRTDINGKQTFIGFDANDLLRYTGNYTLTGIGATDTDNDSIPDSDTATFAFHHGHVTDSVTVVLVGYSDLTISQITAI